MMKKKIQSSFHEQCVLHHAPVPRKDVSFLGPVAFECSRHRRTPRPSVRARREDPQKSPASLRIAVKDLKGPALQCRRLAASV